MVSSLTAGKKLYGAKPGWPKVRASCDHLAWLSPDLTHIPPPNSPCSRCCHPAENWLCLSCKDVLCSRYVNKHMLTHYQETGHCLALGFRDLSVWCCACDAYLDVQMILPLRPVYEVAHVLKFELCPAYRERATMQLLNSNQAFMSLPIKCKCGKLATVRLSGAEPNPRWRFYVCPLYGSSSDHCDFFHWANIKHEVEEIETSDSNSKRSSRSHKHTIFGDGMHENDEEFRVGLHQEVTILRSEVRELKLIVVVFIVIVSVCIAKLFM